MCVFVHTGSGSPTDPDPKWAVFECRGPTFTQEAHQPPDEVAAAVAEGGSGQGDFLQAVTQHGSLGPGLGGYRAASPAVGGSQVRCLPAGLGHVPHSRPVRRGPLGSWTSKRKSSHWAELRPRASPAPKANYPKPNTEIVPGREHTGPKSTFLEHTEGVPGSAQPRHSLENPAAGTAVSGSARREPSSE